MLPGALLFCGQSIQVLGCLDLLAAVPRTRMRRDKLVVFDDSNGLDISEHSQGALRAVVRDGIVVEVEARVGSLADLDIEAVMGGEVLIWQWQEIATLTLEHIAHDA